MSKTVLINFLRDDWNEDWAIVDGAGYHDIQVTDIFSYPGLKVF